METDSTSVATFLERFTAAWKTNDGSAVADFFDADGSIINPFGQRADGRPAVAAMYTEYFNTMLQDTTTTFTVHSIRAIGADYSLVDADQPIYGANGDLVLAAHLTALVRRDGDSWVFVDARPYTTPAAQ